MPVVGPVPPSRGEPHLGPSPGSAAGGWGTAFQTNSGTYSVCCTPIVGTMARYTAWGREKRRIAAVE